MSTSIRSAQRVTAALGGIKWVLVVLWLVGGVLEMAAIWQATTWPVAVMVLAALGALAGAAFAWVSVGWMQHVLGMLVLAQGNVAIRYVAGEHIMAGESVAVSPRPHP